MKRSFYLTILIIIFCCGFSINAQEFNLSKFIDDTRLVARKTGYQSYFEYTFDFKRTSEKKDGEKSSDVQESVCSTKRCEFILVAKNGNSFSEKKIRKNRERAAERLEKAENLPENKFHASKELPAGYGFMISTSFSALYSHFSPNLYLKNCQIKFVEKVSIEKRPTVKLRALGCNVDSDENKNLLQFMPQTEAVIWVDEKDKAVVQSDVYYKNKGENQLPVKPVVVMKAERIPEGFWFWKHITINGLENESFFPKDYGNWQIELYNYKSYTVLIDKVEIDKK